jgi:ankyrin repeat protein
MNIRFIFPAFLLCLIPLALTWASPDVRHTPANVMNLLESSTAYGWTPLHWAARKGDMDEVRRLAAGADLETKDVQGRTPLQIAVKAGQGQVVRTLIDAGADVNTADTWGITPLRRIKLLREVRGWDRTEIAAMIEAAGGHLGTVYQRRNIVEELEEEDRAAGIK